MCKHSSWWQTFYASRINITIKEPKQPHEKFSEPDPVACYGPIFSDFIYNESEGCVLAHKHMVLIFSTFPAARLNNEIIFLIWKSVVTGCVRINIKRHFSVHSVTNCLEKSEITFYKTVLIKQAKLISQCMPFLILAVGSGHERLAKFSQKPAKSQ